MSLPSFIAEVCFVFCAFLLFLSHNLAFHFVGNIQGVFLTCLKTTLHQDSDNTYGDSPWTSCWKRLAKTMLVYGIFVYSDHSCVLLTLLSEQLWLLRSRLLTLLMDMTLTVLICLFYILIQILEHLKMFLLRQLVQQGAPEVLYVRSSSDHN